MHESQPACKNCYAERDFDHRYQKVKWGPSGTRVITTDANWRKPIKWNREAEELGIRKRVFCASLADVFEDWRGPMLNSKGQQVFCEDVYQYGIDADEAVTMDAARKRLFDLIDATPNLDWLLLTKRPENVDEMWTDRRYRQNVWLGTSIENQEWTDRRMPHLKAAKDNNLVGTTFVSAEPLVGPIDFSNVTNRSDYVDVLGRPAMQDVDWVITGGESGPNARPCDPDWFRSLRDQCEATNTPFHFKQWGEFDAEQNRVGKKIAGRLIDGRTHDGVPRQNAMA